jgi:chromosomal replication initiation ATPase DnaA
MIQGIIMLLCDYYNIDYKHFNKNFHSRKREYITIRQFTYRFVRDEFKYSLYNSGKLFNKDHATVLHSLKDLNNLLDTDIKTIANYKKLKRLVKKYIHDYEANIKKDDLENQFYILLTHGCI